MFRFYLEKYSVVIPGIFFFRICSFLVLYLQHYIKYKWFIFTFCSTGPPKFLHPFISDKNVPSELEYSVISFEEPHTYFRQWSDGSVFRDMQLSTRIDCKLLECRNLTKQTVAKPFGVFGQLSVSGNSMEKILDGNMVVDPVFISFGQHTIHSLHKTLQAWQQVSK